LSDKKLDLEDKKPTKDGIKHSHDMKPWLRSHYPMSIIIMKTEHSAEREP